MEIQIEKVQYSGGELAEVRLAQIVAELVRQGVKFLVTESSSAYSVELTGGF